MALTPLQVTNVCNPWNPKGGYGTMCKYLQYGYPNSLCTKLAPSEYAKLVAQRAKWGGHQKESDLGDNCAGFLFLKHKKQGYDIP